MNNTLRFSDERYPNIENESKLNRSNAKLLFTAVSSGDLETMKSILREDEISLANICLAEGNSCGCGTILDTTLTLYLKACNKSGVDALEGTKLLFEHGANILLRLSCGRGEGAAMDNAIRNDMPQVTSFLLAQGVRCPTVHDCKSVEMIELLILHGADVRDRDRYDCTLIFSELHNYEKQREILDFALSHGLDINAVNIFGRTALNCAACHGNARNVQYLCEKGASLDIKDEHERTPLDSAIYWLRCEFNCWCGRPPLHIDKHKTIQILRDEPSFRHNTAVAMAFSMGLHPRLGAQSKVMEFDDELLRMILEKIGIVASQH
jgi:hypothetical protein